MFNIVLHQPKIATNTGAIIRLCANAGCQLHLIEPLGFELNEKKLRRAGLDYHEYVNVKVWQNFDELCEKYDFNATNQPKFFTTKGQLNYTNTMYQKNDFLIFGSETKGLPQSIFSSFPQNQFLKIPMKEKIRSINLANAVSIVTYEAWRQNDFSS